jgi:hypothetical protein
MEEINFDKQKVEISKFQTLDFVNKCKEIIKQ